MKTLHRKGAERFKQYVFPASLAWRASRSMVEGLTVSGKPWERKILPGKVGLKIIIIIILETYMCSISGEPAALTNAQEKNTQNKLLYMKKNYTIEFNFYKE